MSYLLVIAGREERRHSTWTVTRGMRQASAASQAERDAMVHTTREHGCCTGAPSQYCTPLVDMITSDNDAFVCAATSQCKRALLVLQRAGTGHAAGPSIAAHWADVAQVAVAPRLVDVIHAEVVRRPALLELRVARVHVGRVLQDLGPRLARAVPRRCHTAVTAQGTDREGAAPKCTFRQQGQSAATLPITVHREFVRFALPAASTVALVRRGCGGGVAATNLHASRGRRARCDRTADRLQLVLERHQQEADEAQQHDLAQHVLVSGQ